MSDLTRHSLLTRWVLPFSSGLGLLCWSQRRRRKIKHGRKTVHSSAADIGNWGCTVSAAVTAEARDAFGLGVNGL